jgi:hypothetical protein
MTGLEEITVFGFVYLQLADRIEAFGERPDESDRHVLHDENPDREIGGKRREDILQGFRTSGRCGDGDDRRHKRSRRGSGSLMVMVMMKIDGRVLGEFGVGKERNGPTGGLRTRRCGGFDLDD